MVLECCVSVHVLDNNSVSLTSDFMDSLLLIACFSGVLFYRPCLWPSLGCSRAWRQRMHVLYTERYVETLSS